MFPIMSCREPESLTITFEGIVLSLSLCLFAVLCCYCMADPFRSLAQSTRTSAGLLKQCPTLKSGERCPRQSWETWEIIELLYPRLFWDTATANFITNLCSPQSHNLILMQFTYIQGLISGLLSPYTSWHLAPSIAVLPHKRNVLAS